MIDRHVMSVMGGWGRGLRLSSLEIQCLQLAGPSSTVFAVNLILHIIVLFA